MCGGGDDKKALTPAAKPAPKPQIVQEMERASAMGPTGWTPAMVANMGPAVNMTGAMPTSGMTHFDRTNFADYRPRPAARPAPVAPVVRAVPPPPPPRVVTAPPPPPGGTQPNPTIANPDLLRLIQGATGRNAR